jgi:hypothetical protein
MGDANICAVDNATVEFYLNDSVTTRDESTTDPAGWLAKQLASLFEKGTINVLEIQRIIDYGFESNSYTPDTARLIIEEIFKDSFEGRRDKETIINFLSNNIFISGANLINLRNAYREIDENGDSPDIGYLYTVEYPSILNGEGEFGEKYIMFGFGQLTENENERIDIANQGMSPIMFRGLIDSRTGEMKPIRYPGGQITGKDFTKFFTTEEAIVYAIVFNLAHGLFEQIIINDLLGSETPQITVGGLTFRHLEIGPPVQLSTENEFINGGYVEFSCWTWRTCGST